ncbi:hypothetical protein HPB51_021109 [Rhipicephalus microplus]|uniref:Myb/SANT-like DNA-binding domain-containing protein 3 n=1 Tax=Rhipicephalus microplus TaxID=6941 RepID=A0A9J6E3X1_RHIMP|nr:myb/SANT-like DNA-binding domain-containing protein 3 [Rhipicephalus microplus]KAH8028962.1 hypothetical protein HPB51_021109 [Rhipicephalus microplus]
MPAKTPFSEDEKDPAKELVKKYKTVNENKRTDAIFINAKAKAWEKLCTEFNNRPFVRPRDVKQLKKLWDNIRQSWKREKAKHIRDVFTTSMFPFSVKRSPVLRVLGYLQEAAPHHHERKARADQAIVSHLTTRVPNPFDSDRSLDTPAA